MQAKKIKVSGNLIKAKQFDQYALIFVIAGFMYLIAIISAPFVGGIGLFISLIT